MASAASTIVPTSPAPSSAQHNAANQSRGGRSGARGGQVPFNSRGGGRGRGGHAFRPHDAPQRHGHYQHSPLPSHPAPPRPPADDLGGGGVSGHRSIRGAAPTVGEGEELHKAKAQAEDEDVEADVCFICASAVVHNSIAPCNHRTCHICALRLRALYKTRACAHCRTEAKDVVFTDNTTKRFEDFTEADFEQNDETLGIKYTQKDIHADTLLLLRYNCPDHDCDVACWGWPDLHRHVKSVHHKVLCDLCTRNKKVFTHEHELFTTQELRKHEKFGDDHPGAVDQSGFKGHPECGFCRQRFYGDDELYVHCRDKHERCHICDRRNGGSKQQYYVDYNSLEQHFRSDHFMCADQECLEKKFVVFESEMDLKAHQLETHPNGLTKDARRDARRVDISAFDYRAPHQEPHRGRGGGGGGGEREGRGRGRGRDPNTEALPPSAAQPMRRDELAYHRQQAIQNAQSATARTFGGQLTSTDAYAARPTSSSRQETTTAPRTQSSTNPSFPAIDHLDLNPSSINPSVATPAASANQTPQQQARQLQHAAIIDRASTLLSNDSPKITIFRHAVSAYRTSSLTAQQLLDRFFTLFDCSSTDLGKLIKELADIYENEAKRNGLLKVWNDWRAINEDYPSLPAGTSSASAGSIGGGHRVLKLKSSTAQSSRSAVSKQGSWGNTSSSSGAGGAASSSSSSSNHFPAISNTGSIARVGTTTPWVTGAASSSASSARALPAPARTSGAYKPTTSTAAAVDMFPALPAAKKPNTLMAGKTRGTVRWDEGGRNTPLAGNPWAPPPAVGGGESTALADEAAAGWEGDGNEMADAGKGAAGGKKKGKQGKKQMLYKFG